MMTSNVMREITPLAPSDCFTIFSRVKKKFDFLLQLRGGRRAGVGRQTVDGILHTVLHIRPAGVAATKAATLTAALAPALARAQNDRRLDRSVRSADEALHRVGDG